MVGNKYRQGPCDVDDCDSPIEAKRFCRLHYNRRYHGIPLDRPRKTKYGPMCIYCENPPKRLGYCMRHFHQIDKYGVIVPDDAKCRVCGSGKNPQVDHDHACCAGRNACKKCVRGILCVDCNVALGRVYDNPETLRKLAVYLEINKLS